MLREPVRGSIPDPSFLSLSGLDQLRAFVQRRTPSTPHCRLLGYRLTQVNAGTVVLSQPISPWFEMYDGFVDLSMTGELSVFVAALSAAPPATHVRVVNMSLRYLRPCTVENETLIARGRVLHAGSNFTTVESLIEDALGRAVAHVTGSAVIEAVDPPPPPRAAVDMAVDMTIEEPSYPTPDPAGRAVPSNLDTSVVPPLGHFLDVQILDRGEGWARIAMPTSEWMCNAYREVTPGLMTAQNYVAGAVILAGLAGPNERFVTIDVSTTYVSTLQPDGRPLIAEASVKWQRDGTMVLDNETSDADGNTVLLGRGTMLLRARQPNTRAVSSERVLLTVLFTDVVSSTERVRELGDRRWGEVLADHHAVVRRQLELHKGREVKTTGDGFLITFDSPTRAVNCAQAIRQDVDRLGLKIRAGIHTGECERMNADVAGVAVHVAARVMGAAEPSEILVSGTVRDLIAGSGVQLAEKGSYPLKGLDGEWTLFAVAPY